MLKKQKKQKKAIFPQKGNIVIQFRDFEGQQLIIGGTGNIEAVKLTGGEYRFTGILIKDYNKNPLPITPKVK